MSRCLLQQNMSVYSIERKGHALLCARDWYKLRLNFVKWMSKRRGFALRRRDAFCKFTIAITKAYSCNLYFAIQRYTWGLFKIISRDAIVSLSLSHFLRFFLRARVSHFYFFSSTIWIYKSLNLLPKKNRKNIHKFPDVILYIGKNFLTRAQQTMRIFKQNTPRGAHYYKKNKIIEKYITVKYAWINSTSAHVITIDAYKRIYYFIIYRGAHDQQLRHISQKVYKNNNNNNMIKSSHQKTFWRYNIDVSLARWLIYRCFSFN